MARQGGGVTGVASIPPKHRSGTIEVFAPVEKGMPTPAGSAHPCRGEGNYPWCSNGKISEERGPEQQRARGAQPHTPGSGKDGTRLLSWRAIWHPVSKPLKTWIPLTPIDLHLEDFLRKQQKYIKCRPGVACR